MLEKFRENREKKTGNDSTYFNLISQTSSRSLPSSPANRSPVEFNSLPASLCASPVNHFPLSSSFDTLFEDVASKHPQRVQSLSSNVDSSFDILAKKNGSFFTIEQQELSKLLELNWNQFNERKQNNFVFNPSFGLKRDHNTINTCYINCTIITLCNIPNFISTLSQSTNDFEQFFCQSAFEYST
jgi:hypothetical protein